LWRTGDTAELDLAMPVERIVAHPRVSEDAGKVAIRRGPVVYCLEQPDNRAPVRSVVLPDQARLSARFDRRRLGGVTVVEARGLAPVAKGPALYRRAQELGWKPAALRFIPYAFWNNRGQAAMTVWVPRR
jgi:uncharacterized protein